MIGPCLCGDPWCRSCFPGGPEKPDDICEYCWVFFEEKMFHCSAKTRGECDCPKCQGMCKCPN